MPRGQKYRPEKIIPKRRETEVVISRDKTQGFAVKQIGVGIRTPVRWRKQYGGLRMDHAKRVTRPG